MHRDRTGEPKVIPSATTAWMWARSLYPLVLGSLLVVMAAACGSDPASDEEHSSSTAAIYAAVTQQLIELDNTFGPDHRFSEVLVVEHTRVDAGNHIDEGPPGDPLTGEEQTAIVAAIEHLSPVRFISSREEFIRHDVLQPLIPESVIITLAPVEFDRNGATVGANLWCGGVCGLWLTYRVTEEPNGWTVTGTEGDRAIS